MQLKDVYYKVKRKIQISIFSFPKIEQNVLKVFTMEYLLQKDNPRVFDSRLELLAEIANKMRKDIFLIKSR